MRNLCTATRESPHNSEDPAQPKVSIKKRRVKTLKNIHTKQMQDGITVVPYSLLHCEVLEQMRPRLQIPSLGTLFLFQGCNLDPKASRWASLGREIE